MSKFVAPIPVNNLYDHFHWWWSILSGADLFVFEGG